MFRERLGKALRRELFFHAAYFTISSPKQPLPGVVFRVRGGFRFGVSCLVECLELHAAWRLGVDGFGERLDADGWDVVVIRAVVVEDLGLDVLGRIRVARRANDKGSGEERRIVVQGNEGVNCKSGESIF